MKIVWGWLSGDQGRIQRCSISVGNVGNGRSHMDSNSDTIRILINKLHTDRDIHRRHAHIAETDIYTSKKQTGVKAKVDLNLVTLTQIKQ